MPTTTRSDLGRFWTVVYDGPRQLEGFIERYELARVVCPFATRSYAITMPDAAILIASADDLACFLNGGPRPPWLDDLERFDPHILIDVDGTMIVISGVRDAEAEKMIDRLVPQRQG